MRLFAVVFAAVLAGCAVEPPPDQPGQVRQASAMIPPAPQYVGQWTEGRLGTSVAECRVPGFVAGAPGVNAALMVTDASYWFLDPGTSGDAGALGLSVACDGLSPSAPITLTAGDEGLHFLALGGSGQPEFLAVTALARAPLPGLPLVVSQPSRARLLTFRLTDAGYLPAPDVSGPQGIGAALKWHDTGAYFLAGNPLVGEVSAYTWTDAGATMLTTIAGTTLTGFGGALAIADVHPSAGVEFIIGAPLASKVFIYSPTGVLLMTLDGTSLGSTGFGTSLAIEPTPAVVPSLRALWVGDPAHDQVFRFIGDAGAPFTSIAATGSAFGFSMTASEQNLVIGAPLYSDQSVHQGGVFITPFNTITLGGAVVMPCTVGHQCVTSSCQVGTCLGGVACLGPFNTLFCAFGCSNGACVSADGGPLDAGFDAGSPDAGRDAGTPDASTGDAGRDAGNPDVDAGRDAGEADAGEGDAGEGDAGEADAGEADAGEADAGVADAGASDAGGTDAGARDAGASDAGSGADAVQFTSCGCSGGSALPLLLLALALSRRSRRSGVVD